MGDLLVLSGYRPAAEPSPDDALAAAKRRVEVGRHRLGTALRVERPPTPVQIEEARKMAAEGLPVPERYHPWLR